MTLVRCQAVRWVSDDPMPGWVEVRLADAEGCGHTFFDKPSSFEPEGRLRRDAEYPLVIGLDCTIESEGDDGTAIITLAHGVETAEGSSRFRVDRNLLR